MIYFTLDQVLRIHSALVQKTGGSDGLRDKNLLDSALKSPFQTFSLEDLYPTFLEKAAVLCYSLVQNHPFVDGNKRIGVHLMLLFLELNNFNLSYSQKELVDFGFGIASGKIGKDEIKEKIKKFEK